MSYSACKLMWEAIILSTNIKSMKFFAALHYILEVSIQDEIGCSTHLEPT